MINSHFYQEIESALNRRIPFMINERCSLVTKMDDLILRVIHYFSHNRSNWPKINAIWFSKALKEARTNKQAENFDPKRFVSTVKSFLLQYKEFAETEEFKTCALELFAFRLNIPVETLDEKVNPGFYAFAKKHHLRNCLSAHNHVLQWDSSDYQIQIKHQGKPILWSEAKELVDQFEKESDSLKEPYALSLYGEKGIQKRDRYEWKKLNPLLSGESANWADHFIKDPLVFNKKGRAHIIEFCSSAIEERPKVFSGDHTWVRIYKFKKIDEKIIGKMYSIGLYRPYKHNFWLSLYMPFRERKAYIAEDISEVWGINERIKTVAKRIKKASYEEICKKIQTDKKIDGLTYHLFDYNCANYASDLAKLASITLPIKRHFLELLTCTHLKKKWQENLINYPFILQQTVKVITTLFQNVIFFLTPIFNFVFFLLGSPYSLTDIFNDKRLYYSSPWVLGNDLRDEIFKAREYEISQLNINDPDYEKKKNKIRFDFPRFKLD